jgi:hypothetical protein
VSLLLTVIFVLVVAGLGYGLLAEHNRCSHCGQGFVGGAPVRWCLGGHRLHQTCMSNAMGRAVCPICGIYV